MSEYSPFPGTIRSKLVRAELEEPCTRKRTGSAEAPGWGAIARLRHRLSFTSSFVAQYSPLQPGVPAADVAAIIPPAALAPWLPASARPTPSPAPLSNVRRGIGWSCGKGFMVFSCSVAPRPQRLRGHVAVGLKPAPGGVQSGTCTNSLVRDTNLNVFRTNTAGAFARAERDLGLLRPGAAQATAESRRGGPRAPAGLLLPV